MNKSILAFLAPVLILVAKNTNGSLSKKRRPKVRVKRWMKSGSGEYSLVEIRRELTVFEMDMIKGMSKKDASKKIGITPARISQIRKYYNLDLHGDALEESRGIPKRIFTEEEWMIILSNTMEESSRLLGVSISTVRARIKEKEGVNLKDIPKNKRKNTRVWKQSDIELLGKMTDVDVAATINKNRGYDRFSNLYFMPVHVSEKRSERGIPSYSPGISERHRWVEEEISLLGSRPDNEVGRMINEMRNKRGLTYVDMLTSGDVSKKRSERGIPRYMKPEHDWTEEEISLFWDYDDKTVSSMITGISTNKVKKKRKSLGIPTITAIERMKRKEDQLALLQEQKKLAIIQQQLNPELRGGEDFRTRDTQLLKGRNPISTDVFPKKNTGLRPIKKF